MAANLQRSIYELAFQISPIVLVQGIASNIPGGMIPIIALLGGSALISALQGNASLDNFFAQFLPVPGGTLISNAVGEYSFANQQVAANAVIEQPLTISLQMIAPVKDTAGYLLTTATFTALQKALSTHSAAGGLYHVATPAFIYTNCILTGMSDITSSEKQVQIEWQLDFRKPIVSVQSALNAKNALISRIDSGQKMTSGAWSQPSFTSPTLPGTPGGVAIH